MTEKTCNDCDYKNECDVFCYGDIIDLKVANEIIDNQRRKIRELKAQLQIDDESVCIKCKHHYLIKHPLELREFYISKCIKEHDECSKEDIRYCEDFELTGDDYDE